jgi:hypothetical protein
MKEKCLSGFVLRTLPYSSEGLSPHHEKKKNREQLQNLKACHGIVEGTLPELTRTD